MVKVCGRCPRILPVPAVNGESRLVVESRGYKEVFQGVNIY
jgi:hypothetical protein